MLCGRRSGAHFMKKEKIKDLERKGFKTLKQIAKECGKQSISSGKLFCSLNNIKPDVSFPYARGSIDYYSPSSSALIKEFVSKANNEIKNIKRNPNLEGLSRSELAKKYNISFKTVKKYNLIKEEDFQKFSSKPLSPTTLCKKYGIRLCIFQSWNPGAEPTETNIKIFSEKYKSLTQEEKKLHRSQQMKKWNQSPEGLLAKEKAKEALNNLSEDEKKESVKKCKAAKEKNGTLGWNAQCKYIYNGKGYNLTELALQLEHPEWKRIDTAVYKYTVDEKTYDYVPDFFDTEKKQYIEIKGQNFFDKNGKYIDPYQLNRLKNGTITEAEYNGYQRRADSKYKCMIKNNVRIIIDSSDEVKQIVKKNKNLCKNYQSNSASYTSGARKGIKLSEKEKIALSEKHSKPFICINNGKIYKSLRKCADELNIKSVTSITNVCIGKNKQTRNGYIFKYLEDYNKENV